MNFDENVLSRGERITLALRSLYSRQGYQPYRMSKFEDYDLYGKNKDFLISDRVITFTDGDGRLKALKPDVTLSIIKNHSDGETMKLYYNENVYRVVKGSASFKEIMQTGVECIGDVDSAQVGEVLRLAAGSLGLLGESYVLDVSSLDILEAAMNTVTDSRAVQDALARCVGEKNAHGILSICEENGIDASLADPLIALMNLCGSPERVLEPLGELSEKLGCTDACCALSEAVACCGDEIARHIRIDFSVVGDRGYYNGVVFKGFLSGVPDAVLSGGRYDRLMKKLKRKSKAVGFAVYLDKLEREEDDRFSLIPQDGMLNVALPKGRLGEISYAMFEKAGYDCPAIREPNRKLIFENPKAGVRYFWVKPSDVAIYVERGAADIGVVGKDILLEYEPDVYELLDLGIGKCRMAVAAPVGFEDQESESALRVATKFSRIAAAHYAGKGRDIDIVHLNGSIEIAPILGLTDVIVDIVETGATLKENHLEVLETIVPISARLVSNKSSYQFKRGMIERLTRELQHD
jgi:ATP phosphoribosyltransferase regulatory subunit